MFPHRLTPFSSLHQLTAIFFKENCFVYVSKNKKAIVRKSCNFSFAPANFDGLKSLRSTYV